MVATCPSCDSPRLELVAGIGDFNFMQWRYKCLDCGEYHRSIKELVIDHGGKKTLQSYGTKNKEDT